LNVITSLLLFDAPSATEKSALVAIGGTLGDAAADVNTTVGLGGSETVPIDGSKRNAILSFVLI
jgi:hypothetical protein